MVVSPSLQIRQSDYRDLLAGISSDSVDLVLTDPPYCISRETTFVMGGVKRFGVSMDFGEWDAVEIDLDCLAGQLYRVLRKGGTAVIWYDVWKLSYLSDALMKAGFSMRRLLIWEKTNPVPLNSHFTYLSNSREMAVSVVKGNKPVFNASYHSGIYSYPIPQHNKNRLHPTQKPLELFVSLLNTHSNIGDFVVDPFVGSGTTAVACWRTGRNFLGGDISPEYVDVADKRINEEQLSVPLFL